MSDLERKRGVLDMLTDIEDRVKAVQDALPMRQQQLKLTSGLTAAVAEAAAVPTTSTRRNAPLPRKPSQEAFDAVALAVEELSTTHQGGYGMGDLRELVLKLAPGCLIGSNGTTHAQIRLIMCKILGLKVMWGH